MQQGGQRRAGSGQFGQTGIDGGDTFPGQGAHPRPIPPGIQRQQLGNFLQAETGGLGGADEGQATDIGIIIMAHRAAGGRHRQQPLALIEADGFGADPGCGGKAGLLMLSGQLVWLGSAIALVIGGIGAVSVIKAVYIERRSLACACVGGGSNVPLGFVSLLENLMMLAMAGWMLAA